ncbi:MAG: type II toxin-antitoxin system HicA family toxin [Candidatus Omnitrophica bacterium]|nr:type II toxin-antitoxin system HicA family toxin [Candidatus Omnitrophota bacterium]
MSHRLRLCSGVEAVKKFKRCGWTVDRQAGSHVMLVKPDYPYTLSIPQHKELGMGLLKSLIRQADLTVEEFNAL